MYEINLGCVLYCDDVTVLVFCLSFFFFYSEDIELSGSLHGSQTQTQLNVTIGLTWDSSSLWRSKSWCQTQLFL